MPEYIDREKAREAIDDALFFGMSWNTALDEVPAADVRPVVLCGECKSYGAREWDGRTSGICTRSDTGVGAFDFCSYGAKMEEEA